MVVGLRVSRGREVIFDAELYAEFPILGIVELFTVVSDNNSGNTKSADDGLLGEVLDVFLCNLCQRFNFHPLGKVIDDHYQKSHLSLPNMEWFNYVDPPLYEGLGPDY